MQFGRADSSFKVVSIFTNILENLCSNLSAALTEWPNPSNIAVDLMNWVNPNIFTSRIIILLSQSSLLDIPAFSHCHLKVQNQIQDPFANQKWVLLILCEPVLKSLIRRSFTWGPVGNTQYPCQCSLTVSQGGC